MVKLAALILAQSKSKRLPGKNTRDYKGQPMYLVNVKKCLSLFDKVYVSSDSLEILEEASRFGAVPILRGEELCGEMPNIPVYQHAMKAMDCDSMIAVQANSPGVDSMKIYAIIRNMQEGLNEVMTVHDDGSIYGSIWGISRKKLYSYGDPYNPRPEKVWVDNSIDIHTVDDLIRSQAHE